MKIEEIHGYRKFLSEIKGQIQEAQVNALKVVNKQLVSLYWNLELVNKLKKVEAILL